MHLSISNYRCFSDSPPAEFDINDGLIAFIGPNNVGKSALLLFLYEFRTLFALAKKMTLLQTAVVGGASEAVKYPVSIQDNEQPFCDKTDGDIVIVLTLPVTETGYRHPFSLRATVPRNTNTVDYRVEYDGAPIDPERITDAGIHLKTSEVLDLNILSEACGSLANTVYIGPFRHLMRGEETQQHVDLTLGKDLYDQWNRLKQGPNTTGNQRALQVESVLAAAFDVSVLEIDLAADGLSLRVKIDNHQYDLAQVGSGLSHFIVTLINIAIAYGGPDLRPSYILIDEPELNLHATLQQEFLAAVASVAERGVLYSTHSIGLARKTADQIYRVRSKGGGLSVVEPLEDSHRLTTLIGELSFSAYREVGFDKLLLVEGPTDIRAFYEFLRLYGKHRDVLMIPMGGSPSSVSDEILAEMSKITDASNISIIMDSERDSEGASIEASRRRLEVDATRLGMKCHFLDRRSIENYFTQSAIDTACGSGFTALGPYEKYSDMEAKWGKSNNWKIASQVDKTELDENDLGQWLDAF